VAGSQSISATGKSMISIFLHRVEVNGAMRAQIAPKPGQSSRRAAERFLSDRSLRALA
jgi:hypothetical protein